MQVPIVAVVVALGLMVPSAAVADSLGTPVDLSAFDEVAGGAADAVAANAVAADIQEVAFAGGTPVVIRPYVSGIVGASFGTVVNGGTHAWSPFETTSISGNFAQTMFTGGGALGMAIARPIGQVRMEVEGRARGPITGQELWRDSFTAYDRTPLHATISGGWSSLVNFWRDVDLNDAVGLYLGGGFGAGGYQVHASGPTALGEVITGSSTVTTFAWQVGTGVTYRWTDRVTLDLGYRFFAMTPASTGYRVVYGRGAYAEPVGTYTSALSASELLCSIRIYEPLRGFIR